MVTKAITLNLPEPVYERYMQRAAQTQRSIEDELLAVVSVEEPADGLPPELAREVEALASLSDKALWKVARSRLSAKAVSKLSQLNYKQQATGRSSLSQDEVQAMNELLYQHDRYLLLRAEAAVLLKGRGYDIAGLANLL